jgi:hypothetical protein
MKAAVLMPKSEVIGLAQIPTHAPLLQHAKNSGTIELVLPVMVVQIVFTFAIVLFYFTAIQIAK